MEFNKLDLHPDLKRGLLEAGYITCMAVQEQVLENAFDGKDLYVQSQTGTGKTAAFLVVIFQRLLSEPMLHGKKAIIMVPTRELAVQVEEEAKVLGKYLPFKTGSFYGGVGYTQQTAMLRNNVDIMVGTPGRVLDLNQSGQMNLMEIAFLVLDEADRMFDMGFYPDLRKLIKAVPPADRRQTMLFSATLNAWVKNLAWEYTRSPFEIAIEPETVTVEEVDQVLYHVASADKMKLLLGILKRENPESAIIFCNTKRYAEITAKRLRINGYDCEFIMGDLPQVKRLKIIDDIKAGKLRYLVATDVAARGLDIESLALVVNYDVPNEAENYVHRIGRTARAGKTGKAVTLASEQDVYELPGIERYIGRKVPSETATEELFAEDRSEGRHIRTDFYDEGSGRKPSPARGKHEDKAGGRSRERGKPRPVERVGKKGGQRLGKQEQGHRESPAVKPRNQPGPKLSELSLEERMAYYKKKYDTSPAPASNMPQPNEKKQQGRMGENRKRGGKQADGRKAPRPQELNKSADVPAVNQTPPRKNLLSKLFGFFKKDKKDKENK
ncbi:MAG: DEAD/DEAH box helicase [Treponema sp.]|jgi:ATP-dependent RNA helicase RhlB|nr:DEAD/DEAH box helicase [Treponema sp.]